MDKPTFRQHISSQFNAELEDVRQRVMAMGGLVEQQIIDATTALMNLDAELADQVRANDDKIHQLERAIEEECPRLLPRRQPTASPLGLVYETIKTHTERNRVHKG